jgi:hypothetical protein
VVSTDKAGRSGISRGLVGGFGQSLGHSVLVSEDVALQYLSRCGAPQASRPITRRALIAASTITGRIYFDMRHERA